MVDGRVAKEDYGRGEEGGGWIAPVLDGVGWDRADEDVADDASAERGGKGEDHDPEEVEFVLYSGGCALEGEDEGAEEVDAEEERRRHWLRDWLHELVSAVEVRRSSAPLEMRSLATHSPRAVAGVSRVASVSIWTMASPSGATTWAYMRHLPGAISLGGTQWAPMGSWQPPPRASRVVRSASTQ